MSTDNPTVTPDEINLINIEIAKLCGWKMVEFKKADYVESLKTVITATYKRWSKNNSKTSTKRVPDYYSSLDACSEFEKILNPYRISNDLESSPLWCQYVTHLGAVVGMNGSLISATAPQRCEAYLRLHGKWPVGRKSD